MTAEVSFEHVTKLGNRGERARVSDLSFEIAPGEFVVVVGPSGSGKSTTLRILAGLEEADSGVVLLSGKDTRALSPAARDVAMVFQGYALYPQMTAWENMEFPLKMRKVAKEVRRDRVHQAAELLRLTPLLKRRPSELSGGERQRVAMGRALVREPRVFLFDEPLSNLDAALRRDLRHEIGSLVRKVGASALYVTHDQTEAMTLADRIVVMHEGKLMQAGPPKEMYERPKNVFVATFLGSPAMNIIPASSLPLTQLPKGAFQIGIRPEHLALARESGKGWTFAGSVLGVEPLGAETHLLVDALGTALRVRQEGFSSFAVGERVYASFCEEHLHAFDENGERV